MENHIQLDIKAHETLISYLSNNISLPIGFKNLSGFEFQHSPITPYEAEIAIEHIENAIIPARKRLPQGQLILFCHDDKLHLLLENSHTQGTFLATSLIESVFNELVNVINGSPANATTLPTNKEFSAFLLIIREITHHWNLDGVTYG